MFGDLVPEEVLPRLQTEWLGRPYLYEEEVDSTNTRVEQLAQRGASHGTVMAANAQTNGRGRLQREWHSPAAQNLYFSVLLRPDWEIGTPLSLAVGVALAEAVEPLLPARPTLKWPNDLLFEGRKLAGILVEAAIDRQAVQHVIVGIGLNVNVTHFPDELADLAGSLFLATGQRQHRAVVLARILERLELWIDRLQREGVEPVLTNWPRYAPWMGKQVTVSGGGPDLVGIAMGLESQGALRIIDEHGQEHSVLSGDVELPKDATGRDRPTDGDRRNRIHT